MGRFDGFAGYLEGDIEPGDYYFGDQDTDFLFANGEGEVLAVNGAARTITFAGNARSSASQKVVHLWIRKPPPNS